MSNLKNEKQKIWQSPHFNKIELLHATYVTQSFPRHFHDCYAIGVIEKGVLGFNYLNKKNIALPGNINIAIPGESHDGFSPTEQGWTYRMFYIKTDLMQQIFSELSKKQDIPCFSTGVIEDKEIAAQLLQLHIMLELNETSLLGQETILIDSLSKLTLRFAEDCSFDYKFGDKLGGEHKAISLIKDYIESNYHNNFSINDLAQIANLSPYYLTRVFSQEVGLPPHAFLTQVRINKAKSLLTSKNSIAQIAYQTGFVDQSHFTRAFKKIVGVSPGQYSKNIQDAVH